MEKLTLGFKSYLQKRQNRKNLQSLHVTREDCLGARYAWMWEGVWATSFDLCVVYHRQQLRDNVDAANIAAAWS